MTKNAKGWRRRAEGMAREAAERPDGYKTLVERMATSDEWGRHGNAPPLHPDYQNQGYGGALMKSALRHPTMKGEAT